MWHGAIYIVLMQIGGRRQHPPEAPAELGALWVRRLTRINQMLRRRARLDGGLTLAQADVLALIDDLGQARVTELAERRHCSQPAASQLVERLVGDGLVVRRVDDGDRRAAHVELTAEGRRLLSTARAHSAALIAERIMTLTPAERTVLAQALPVLDRILDDDPDQGGSR